MYWWNASKLAKDLAEDKVSEKDRFYYYLATLISWAILAVLLPYSGGNYLPPEPDQCIRSETGELIPVPRLPIISENVEDLIYAAVLVGVIISCSILCYQTNKDGDDRDFIGRVVCLGWPVMVRVFTILLPMMFFLAFLSAGDAQRWPPDPFSQEAFRSAFFKNISLIWSFMIAGACLIYLQTIRTGLSEIAKIKSAKDALQNRKSYWSSEGVLVAVSVGIMMPVGFIFIKVSDLPRLSQFCLSYAWLWLLYFLFLQWERWRGQRIARSDDTAIDS